MKALGVGTQELGVEGLRRLSFSYYKEAVSFTKSSLYSGLKLTGSVEPGLV